MKNYLKDMLIENDYMGYIKDYGVLFATSFVLSLIPIHNTFDRIKRKFPVYVLLIIAFVYSVYYIYMGLNDPFMYFKF